MANGNGAQSFRLSREQMEYLQETERYRRGQKRQTGPKKHMDDEWIIACDLIGIPRQFADELKKAMMGRFNPAE